jgi:hypothetical protein
MHERSTVIAGLFIFWAVDLLYFTHITQCSVDPHFQMAVAGRKIIEIHNKEKPRDSAYRDQSDWLLLNARFL